MFFLGCVITIQKSFPSQVIQKAMVEVYEEGSVAAASTGVIMSYEESAGPPPVDFVADHPFIILSTSHQLPVRPGFIVTTLYTPLHRKIFYSSSNAIDLFSVNTNVFKKTQKDAILRILHSNRLHFI